MRTLAATFLTATSLTAATLAGATAVVAAVAGSADSGTHRPAAPIAPAARVSPATSAIPGVPATSAIPGVPATSAVPGIPATSAVPGIPGIPAPGPAAAGSDPAAPRGEFGWPLPGTPAVVRPFDPPDHPYGPGHRGVDLAGWDGQPVLAAGDGVVAFAGVVAGTPVVSVDHPNGLRTTYEPVAALVTAGQRVARGEQIGVLRAGHPRCRFAACLHWGVRRGEEYLDPLRLLALGRVRLLPAP